MAVTQTTNVPVRQSAVSPTLVLLAGWLVPGLGHVLVKKPIRAALLFVSIVSMFFLGMMMHGKVYSATNGDVLDLLGFVGQMGSPLLYVIAHAASLGGQALTDTVSDYGSKFAVVAGLLNVMAAVDAQSLANGRKEGL
ncbi:DUF6677 family protein [Terriglobus roseus]|uniref:DUF6677 domain-containing protein n=1 Tax=Terriglobus roseus TaxID=392734 RepID=A0A1G7L7I1_9BACT|nr:DUF6677 family protein [Terriglobus roseus]SDF45403.1 hypothetical protein SAMN05444167_2459 [Terriglobus roseus]